MSVDGEVPDEAMVIGSITGTYSMMPDGDMIVTVNRPDFSIIPAVVQLGIVELIREDVMHDPTTN